jgi:hypothetical protein
MNITDEGPSCIATSRGISDCSIKKFTYDGKEISESVIFSGDNTIFYGYYGCSREQDKIWVVYDHDIYYLPQDGEKVLIASEGTELVTGFKWNPQTQKCYFKKSGKYLISIGTDPDSEEKISDNCKYWTVTLNDGEVIGFMGVDNQKYLLIGDEILPE